MGETMASGLAQPLGERAGRSTSRVVEPGELAWIAAVPCALAVVGLMLLAARWLGETFLAPRGAAMWPPGAIFVFGRPEPAKHACYLIALLGPVLLTGALLANGRGRIAARDGAIRAAVCVCQALTLGFLLLATLAQYEVLLHRDSNSWEVQIGAGSGEWRPFNAVEIAVALLGPLLLVTAMRNAGVRERVARWSADTPARRIVALVLALGFAAAWLLSALDSDGASGTTIVHALIPWGMNDPFAILDGRTVLVDYRPMYAELWPYPLAAGMRVLGTTVLAYSALLTVAGVLTLLALYATFVRLVGRALLALALFVPVVAAGFLVIVDTPGSEFSNVQLFSMWPMRFGGPYVLAWLTVRHLDGVAPRRLWPLFLLAGVLLIDNLEFGASALAALIVALVCAQPPRTPADAARQAGEAALGVIGAVLLFVVFTLARSGEPPRFGLVLEFPHLFGVLGWTAAPMPRYGFHLVLYVTFVAAIAVAVVRALRGERGHALTGMLAWSGVFGLLAASYYIGRSDQFKLGALFSPWALCVALLTIVVVRALVAREWRRPRFAELAVLVGFALALAFALDTPAPWTQVARVARATPTAAPLWKQPTETRFVAAHTHRGERVAILIALGHRIAYDTGIVNVSPYSFIEVMPTREQFERVIATMREEGARRLFLPAPIVPPQYRAVLARAGFVRRASSATVEQWLDAVGG
jgi:hypothetical protein